jgi:DNA mismatch endonuclease (patch repair protein)
MADVFSSVMRSRIMARVKSRGNAATELRLIEILRAHNIKGWRRRALVFGSPDFIFLSARIAVFVDGCFWHGCPLHGSVPKSNRAFWEEKINRNRKRDRVVARRLRGAGWRVLRIWQHELRNPRKVASRINRLLREPRAQVGP